MTNEYSRKITQQNYEELKGARKDDVQAKQVCDTFTQ